MIFWTHPPAGHGENFPRGMGFHWQPGTSGQTVNLASAFTKVAPDERGRRSSEPLERTGGVPELLAAVHMNGSIASGNCIGLLFSCGTEIQRKEMERTLVSRACCQLFFINIWEGQWTALRFCPLSRWLLGCNLPKKQWRKNKLGEGPMVGFAKCS